MISWDQYRRQYVTPNGWRYAGPGVYVHQESGLEWQPFKYTNPPGKQAWQLLAEAGKAPEVDHATIQRLNESRV